MRHLFVITPTFWQGASLDNHTDNGSGGITLSIHGFKITEGSQIVFTASGILRRSVIRSAFQNKPRHQKDPTPLDFMIEETGHYGFLWYGRFMKLENEDVKITVGLSIWYQRRHFFLSVQIA